MSSLVRGEMPKATGSPSYARSRDCPGDHSDRFSVPKIVFLFEMHGYSTEKIIMLYIVTDPIGICGIIFRRLHHCAIHNSSTPDDLARPGESNLRQLGRRDGEIQTTRSSRDSSFLPLN